MKVKLTKGTKVFLSEAGYNGFFYPTRISETLIEQTIAIERSWVGAVGKTAFLVPESSINPTGDSKKYAVVWIDNDSLNSVKLKSKC